MQINPEQSIYPDMNPEHVTQFNNTHFGLSIRQHYAGLAMQGLLASESPGNEWGSASLMADHAVACADALIKALDKNPSEYTPPRINLNMDPHDVRS